MDAPAPPHRSERFYDVGPAKKMFGDHKPACLNLLFQTSLFLDRDPVGYARIERDSSTFDLYRIMLDRSSTICQERGLAPGSDEAAEVLQTGYQIARDIALACGVPYLRSDAIDPQRSEEQVLQDLHSHSRLRALDGPLFGDWQFEVHPASISRNNIQGAVSGYLARPEHMDPRADRLLITLLIESEVVPFQREMMGYPKVAGFIAPATAAEKALDQASKWPLLLAKEIAIAIGAAAVTAAVGFELAGIASGPAFSSSPFSQNFAVPASLILGTIGAALVLVVGAIYAFGKASQRRRLFLTPDNPASKLLALMDAMKGPLVMVSAPGSVAVSALREKIQRAEGLGGSFPPVLRVYIENLEAHGVRAI